MKPAKNKANKPSLKDSPNPPEQVKWEYHIEFVSGGSISARKLEELGAEGWELCGTVASTQAVSDLSSNWPGVVQFYFKRQRTQKINNQTK